MADTDKSLYNLRYNQLTSNLEGFGGGSPQWTLLTLNNVDPQQVPVTRQINTVTPLQGGGNLTVDRTLSILQATNIEDGYLSAVDWNTFNNKQVAGNYITALTGDATATGPGSVPLTLATVNGNVGTFSYASITVNGKGLITSASNGATGSLTDTGTDGIVVTGGTGAVLGSGTSIAQNVADASHNGYLSSTDWSTFNSKQSPLTFGNLTDAGTDGITITGGTGAVIGSGTSLSQHVADSTHSGYLSSTDWSTFNGKQAAGSYITALTGDVTASGPGSAASTLATVNANVGSFTNANITVNAKGLITAASNGVASGVTSVSGTTNQITSTGGTTPVLAIANPLTLPGAMTAGGAIAMGSNKITGLADGTAAGDATAFGQVLGFRVLQIIQTTTTAATTTTGSTFVTGNIAGTITPASTSSKILIVATSSAIVAASSILTTTLFRGTTTNLGDATNGMNVIGANSSTVSMVYLDSPATTSAMTYSVYIKSSTGASGVGQNDTQSNIILFEIG